MVNRISDRVQRPRYDSLAGVPYVLVGGLWTHGRLKSAEQSGCAGKYNNEKCTPATESDYVPSKIALSVSNGACPSPTNVLQGEHEDQQTFALLRSKQLSNICHEVSIHS